MDARRFKRMILSACAAALAFSALGDAEAENAVLRRRLREAESKVRRYEKERELDEDANHEHDVYKFTFCPPGSDENVTIAVTTRVEKVTRDMTKAIPDWEKAESERMNARFRRDFEAGEADEEAGRPAWMKYFGSARERDAYLRPLLGEICMAGWRVEEFRAGGAGRMKFYLADIPSYNLMVVALDCVGPDGKERHVISAGVNPKNGFLCIIGRWRMGNGRSRSEKVSG